MTHIQPSVEGDIERYFNDALSLLKRLIETPSLSKEEENTANILFEELKSFEIEATRKGNNIYASNKFFDPQKPSILLNSHHDTVKPNKGYTKDPFSAIVEDDKLYGLGSNDAGGCLVSLLQTFRHFYHRADLPYNLLFAGTAEEENSGKDGVESILADLGPIDVAIVGEPTEMQMAVAEKGLMVLDCYAKGESGHAARNTGVNAIYKALEIIKWIEGYQFARESPHLGAVKMSVTMINAGYQHNVVPDVCHFVVDVRTTERYTNKEVLSIIDDHVDCEVIPRSTRLNPSSLPEDHAFFKVATDLGVKKFGSPTTSDQAVMDFATFKMGPGKSERSHTPDEFIYLQEINKGISGYIELLDALFKYVK